MTISLGNRAKMSTSTTGTGTITLGSAVSGFQTFADAGITNGQTVRYAIDDGANFEIGSGTYTSSGTTLTRSVTESSNSDSAISLSGSAEVFIAATVADLNPLYAANPDSPTAPSATGSNAVAIGPNSTSSASQSIAIGSGTVASHAFAVAIGYNAQANTAFGATALTKSYASGQYSFAAAIDNNTSSYGATGDHSVAIGPNAKASGYGSLSLGKQNTASASYSTVVGSYVSTASANYSGVFGGRTNTASSTYATVVGGTTNVASGQYSAVIGGFDTQATGTYSFASGGEAVSAQIGKVARASGKFAARGDAQGGQFVLRSDTTDATAEAMTTNNSTAGSTNQIVAASDTCITFHGTITAMQNGAQAYGGWEIKGMLVNDGGTTSLALGNVSDMAATNASSWAVALSADNTNNALKIQVTGEASHNIRWVANVQTAEVTYA